MDIYLSKSDKLDILVQRIYSQYKGLGVIDDIRDMKIEGVSAGVSGRYGEPSTVWILYRGVSLHLAFLKFDSDRELERVCMNIYRYGSYKFVSPTLKRWRFYRYAEYRIPSSASRKRDTLHSVSFRKILQYTHTHNADKQEFRHGIY